MGPAGTGLLLGMFAFWIRHFSTSTNLIRLRGSTPRNCLPGTVFLQLTERTPAVVGRRDCLMRFAIAGRFIPVLAAIWTDTAAVLPANTPHGQREHDLFA